MGRQHGFLYGVVRVLSGTTAPPGGPVQLGAVTPEQFGERVAVARQVGRQQFAVGAGAGVLGDETGHAADSIQPGTGWHFTRKPDG